MDAYSSANASSGHRDYFYKNFTKVLQGTKSVDTLSAELKTYKPTTTQKPSSEASKPKPKATRSEKSAMSAGVKKSYLESIYDTYDGNSLR